MGSGKSMERARNPECVVIAEKSGDERTVWCRILREHNYEVLGTDSGQKAAYFIEHHGLRVGVIGSTLSDMSGAQLLRDIRVKAPGFRAIAIIEGGALEQVIESIELVATDCIRRPVDPLSLVESVKRAIETNGEGGHRNHLHDCLRRECGVGRIVHTSLLMKRLVERAVDVARSELSTVLIQGESGTGKDVLARAMHVESRRWRKPFTRIVCSAIPEALLESELFGHERGAFTDAKTRKEGLLELASGGTVFLDEIGEISPSIQVKLLSVLEARVFRRVGGTGDIPLNARVIAASNSNLAELVRNGRFREDLYYRLNVVRLVVPPLRERFEDLPRLAREILRALREDLHKPVIELSERALETLEAHSWPGNVRELKNVLERAVVFCRDKTIDSEHIELIEACSLTEEDTGFNLPLGGIQMSDLEQNLVLQALKRQGGNQTRAARLLGISREQLSYRLRKYRAEREDLP